MPRAIFRLSEETEEMELNSLGQQALFAMLATAVLVVVTLTAVQLSVNDPLLSAAQAFAWAASALGAHLVLDAACNSIAKTPAPRRRWRRTRKTLSVTTLAVGVVAWFTGASQTLRHFGMPGWQRFLLQGVLFVSIIVAVSALEAEKTASEAELKKGSSEAES
jgi:uncharacterized membrane protein